MGPTGLTGTVLRRGEEGYEAARRAAVWNGRAPDRFPDLVVQADDADDVIAAVTSARREGMRVGVRAGGHSWAGNHCRDGGMLLDVSRLDEVDVDRAGMRARVGPGVHGDELLARLAADGLFFPAGHCPGVGLGGYLLQGGYGWNGRVHGPACMSVEAIDVVTAAGELVRADAQSHPDLLWAARGSGPGFFGVVVAFHVRLYERPKVIANGVHLLPVDMLDEVFSWAQEIGPSIPRAMEMMVFLHRGEDDQVQIAVTGPVLMNSEEEARAALDMLVSCPGLERAIASVPYVPASMDDLYAGAAASYPDGRRYAVDNMWTHAPVELLLPGLHRIAETLPEAPSHMLWMNWGPSAPATPARPDMAYSVEDETYIALYGVWGDAADDAVNTSWATERMREMEPLASGIQLADENLAARPARFVSDENLARLDAIRGTYDPDGLFHPWMGRLWEAGRNGFRD